MQTSQLHSQSLSPSSGRYRTPPAGLLESHNSIVQYNRSSARVVDIGSATDSLRFAHQAAHLNAQVAAAGTGAAKRLVATSPPSTRFQNLPGRLAVAQSGPNASSAARVSNCPLASPLDAQQSPKFSLQEAGQKGRPAAGRPEVEWQTPRNSAFTQIEPHAVLHNDVRQMCALPACALAMVAVTILSSVCA